MKALKKTQAQQMAERYAAWQAQQQVQAAEQSSYCEICSAIIDARDNLCLECENSLAAEGSK